MKLPQSFFSSFIIISVIIFSIIAGDFFLTQYLDEKNQEKENFQENISQSIETPQPISLSDTFIEELHNNKILNIYALPTYKNSFLFGKFLITQNDNNISLSTTEYRKKEKKTDTESEYMKVYEFSFQNISIEEAYTQTQKTIKNQLKNNLEAKIVEINQYGKKSFVIRLENNQKTMYLVIESAGRLLGIEYPLGKDFSRHKDLDKVLKTLFPLIQ